LTESIGDALIRGRVFGLICGNLDDKTHKELMRENTELKSQNEQLKGENIQLANELKDREQALASYESMFQKKKSEN